MENQEPGKHRLHKRVLAKIVAPERIALMLGFMTVFAGVAWALTLLLIFQFALAVSDFMEMVIEVAGIGQ